MSNIQKELSPCPWCGGEASEDWYDRGGSIGCKTCGYRIPYRGLLRVTPNDHPIPYKHEDGSIGLAKDGQTQEYYYVDAHKEAYDHWNTRTPDPRLEVAVEALEEIIEFNAGTEIEDVWSDKRAKDALAKIKGC